MIILWVNRRCSISLCGSGIKSRSINQGGLNIKMVSYQYRDSHVKDKTVSPTVLSLTWESPYLEKMVFILSRGSKLWSGSNIWLSNELIPAGDPSSDKSISQDRKWLRGLHIMMMNQKAHYRISMMVLNHGTTDLTWLPIYGKNRPLPAWWRSGGNTWNKRTERHRWEHWKTPWNYNIMTWQYHIRPRYSHFIWISARIHF